MAKVRVHGVNSTIRNKLSDEAAEVDSDEIVRQSIHRFGANASDRSPIDTGLLSGTMISGIEKSLDKKYGKWELGQRTDYTLVQEFEHASHSGFIRNSIAEEEPIVQEELRRRFKGGKDG